MKIMSDLKLILVMIKCNVFKRIKGNKSHLYPVKTTGFNLHKIMRHLPMKTFLPESKNQIIQCFQNKVLRNNVDASWYCFTSIATLRWILLKR